MFTMHQTQIPSFVVQETLELKGAILRRHWGRNSSLGQAMHSARDVAEGQHGSGRSAHSAVQLPAMVSRMAVYSSCIQLLVMWYFEPRTILAGVSITMCSIGVYPMISTDIWWFRRFENHDHGFG